MLASVVSSCGQPLDGVTFESQDIVSVTAGSAQGVYNLEVCMVPLEVTLAKDGYELVTSTISGTSFILQMTCMGKKALVIIEKPFIDSVRAACSYCLSTIFQKLHFSKSHFSERPQEKYEHDIILHFKSLKKCHKNFEHRLTNK